MRGTRPVLAVLPFGTASGDAGNEVLSCGFVADLTAEFARFASLDVIAPLSSVAVAAMTDVEAAERLGATHLLRGHFQHNGDRLRIAATLVDGVTGTQIWSEKLEAPEGGLFDMQDELIARIAATLTARLEETTLRHSRRKPPESLSAYELTLRGFALVRQGSAAADEEARGLFGIASHTYRPCRAGQRAHPAEADAARQHVPARAEG
jgi:adenylate cyclase